MLRKIVIICVLFLFQFAIAFLLYLWIKKEMEKRRVKAENRIKTLSQTEEGKKLLEQEASERIAKTEKYLNVSLIGYFFAYLLMFVASFAGVYISIQELKSGKPFREVMFQSSGKYINLFAPFLLIFSGWMLVNLIRDMVKKDK